MSKYTQSVISGYLISSLESRQDHVKISQNHLNVFIVGIQYFQCLCWIKHGEDVEQHSHKQLVDVETRNQINLS